MSSGRRLASCSCPGRARTPQGPESKKDDPMTLKTLIARLPASLGFGGFFQPKAILTGGARDLGQLSKGRAAGLHPLSRNVLCTMGVARGPVPRRGMAVGCGSCRMNGGFEDLENGGERHPDGASAGNSLGGLSRAVEPDKMVGARQDVGRAPLLRDRLYHHLRRLPLPCLPQRPAADQHRRAPGQNSNVPVDLLLLRHRPRSHVIDRPGDY